MTYHTTKEAEEKDVYEVGDVEYSTVRLYTQEEMDNATENAYDCGQSSVEYGGY